MNKKGKTQRGITLIALVITIIVMLILVAVTISMAVNGGLFNYAGDAVGETQNALDVEQQLANGAIQVNGVWYDSIDDYLKGKPALVTIHSWTRGTGEDIDKFTCSHCNTTYTMGQTVPYTDAGVSSTTMTAAKSGLDKYYAKNSSYPSSANVDANGVQTIEAQDTTWVVLGIQDIDGDNVNETLLITTQEPVLPATGKDVFFCGAAAYNNGPDEINRICKELYSNSEYGEARGMTIEDVNSALNYTPHGGEYIDADENPQTTGNFTTKLKDLPTWNNIKANGTYTPDGTNTEASLGEYELNGYRYGLAEDLTLTNIVNETTTSITQVENDLIFGENWDYAFWMASRGVWADPDYANFGPGFVGGGSATSCYDWFWSGGGEGGYYFGGLRPVVSLTSKLPELKDK